MNDRPTAFETVEWQTANGVSESSAALGALAECQDGFIHLVSKAEYTLCGDALEGDSDESGGSYVPACRPTKMKTVTCPRCVEIIQLCKGVRISKNPR